MGIDLGYMVVLYAFNGDSNGDIAAISGAADETTTNDGSVWCRQKLIDEARELRIYHILW